jgi:DnaJ-domain-containing protein 1
LSGIGDFLRDRARAGLNAAQTWVTDVDSRGGFEAFLRELTERVRAEEERIASGRHPLNPEYRAEVRRWYARLELEPGATAEDVRRSFRALMRRYHPDRYAGDPDHELLATRLSQELTVAYEGILAHLGER